MDQKAELVATLKAVPNIIYREPGKVITLLNGQETEFYVDVKKAYGYAAPLKKIAECVYTRFDPRTTCTAVEGLGAYPLGTAIEILYGIPCAYVRKEAKNHGKGGLIDGHVPTKEDKVAVLNDVWTTGGSSRDVVERMNAIGVEVTGCHVVVRRGPGNLDDRGVPVTHELIVEDLLA